MCVQTVTLTLRTTIITSIGEGLKITGNLKMQKDCYHIVINLSQSASMGAYHLN